jgi:hypothetical protein
MKSIYEFLTSKKVAWLFTILAVTCRIINVLFVSEGGRDKIYLALQSKNLLAGNGLSISKYLAGAIESPVYDFTPMWPPGYPVLLAPFLKIFNYDVYWATTTLDIISCIFFIFLLRRIAIELKFPAAAVNIVTLIAGCFDYAFIYESLPTDAPSFVLFLFGFFLLLRVIQNEKIQLGKLVVVSIFLFLPCTFRYSYPPLSIAALLAVVVWGSYLKNGPMIKKGLISLTILSLLLIAFFITLKSSTGKAGYIVNTGRGFFPENLLDWAPIGPGAFLNTFFTTSQLKNITGVSVQQAFGLLEIISAIMIVGFTIFFIQWFFRKKNFKSIDPFKSFLLIGFFISAATFASLAWLSVTYKPQPGWGNYLGEPRYFMFVTLYLQLVFIGWIFLFSSWKKSFLQKLIVFSFSLLLFIEITHSIYFHTKVALNFDKHRSATYKEADYVYFNKMIGSIDTADPDAEILIISDGDEFYPLLGSFLGYKGIYNGLELTRSVYSIKKKSILILALYDPELPAYQSFLSEQKAKLLDRVNNVNFYRVDIAP